MRDLTDPFWIKLKGLLFLGLGIAAAALLFADQPTLKTATLLAVCIWSCCRFYYFAFYVIEKYVDSKYRFSGLWDFAGYLLRKPPRDPR
jgi:hypothetical protein